MNLSDDKRSLEGETSGAGAGLGTGAQAGPAHPSCAVGAVGFGPAWTAEDSMAASIVRLECEAEELRAEVALLREQARIITAERDEARLQYGSTHALAEALAKTQVELKAERDEARKQLESLK